MLAATALAACSATKVYRIVSPTAAPSSSSTASAGGPDLLFQLVIPTSATLRRVRPQYVSPATASIAIALDGGSVTAQNVGSADPGCASANGGITCTIAVAAKAGQHSLVVETLDRPNSGTSATFSGLNGNVLSSATLPLTVSATSATTVYSTSLNGVPASVLIAPAPGQSNVAGTQSTGFTFTTASGSAEFVVVALDADGNPIVGPGAPALAPLGTPSGMTLTPVANSQDLYTATYTSAFLGGPLGFSATQPGSASAVSASAAVKGDVALIAVTQTGQLGTFSLNSGPNQISVYNVTTPASPQLVATLQLPACPGGSTQYGANAVFDSNWNIVTGYFCNATGAYSGELLAYALNGSTYAATPAVLDSSYPVSLVALSGKTLDVQTFAGLGNAGDLAVYTYTPASLTATLSAPAQSLCSGTPCLQLNDMLLDGGTLYGASDYAYTLPGNTYDASDVNVYSSLQGPFGMAVDGSGNIWLTTNSLPSTYSGPEIAETNGITGNVLGSSLPPPISNPLGIDFDVNGNLWIVDQSGTVVAFTPGPDGTVEAVRRANIRRFSSGSTPPLVQFNLTNAVYVRAAR